MPMNEHAYALMKELDTTMNATGVSRAMAGTAGVLLTAGNELTFYQDPAVAALGRELEDIGQEMGRVLQRLGQASTRIAGLL